MRALLVGLLAFGSSLGAAYAEPCRLDGLQLVAKPMTEAADPKLVGARFRVVRQSSSSMALRDPAGGPRVKADFIAVVVEGEKGRFFVDQSFIPGSSPWISAQSSSANEIKSNVDWNKRNRRREAELLGRSDGFDIYEGPLMGLTLQPINCGKSRSD